ncbi:nucleoprotein TPR-like [Oscarella lobularis]|uniref:nucleoprotein TPR-like n=1 Tax=Oscarella lobularis TaxID=121494 RepID=UPI003313B452
MGNVFARVVEAYDRRIDVASRALQESNSAKDMLALAAENKFHRVEKELRSVGERLKLHETENAKLRKNISEKDSVLRDLNERLNHLSSARDLTSREKNELVEKLEKSEEGRQELIVILEKKNDVIAKLDEEWNDMSARLAKANKAKNDAMLQLGEIQSKETLSKSKEQRLAEEKELLTSQNEWLQSQLRAKSNEMVSMRHERASDRVYLRVQLSAKEQEVGRLGAIAQETQKVNRELEAKLDVYLNKLKEVRDEKMASDEHHNNELAAQSKLTALYQKSSEELDGRVQEMLTAVEELQVTVDRGNKYQAELEEEKETLAARAGLLETKVKELEEKLEEARSHSLSEKTLREVYPSAAASSARLKSGMTLTQIYSSYVDAKEALTKEQEENKELRKEMDLILRELKTKALMLQEQRKRFEETLTMNDYIKETR